MPWLTDLAGKAENLLNQLDQNAAQALQKPNQQHKVDSTFYRSASSNLNHENFPYADYVLPSTSISNRNDLSSSVATTRSFGKSSSKRDQKSSGYASSISSLSRDREKEEDKLFESLNQPVSHVPSAPPTTVFEASISRRSSSSSLRSLPNPNVPVAIETNDEISGQIDKRISGKSLLQSQTYASYGQIGIDSDLRSKLTDLEKQLQQKDGQLTVLRVRLQESSQQLQIKTEALARCEQDRRRMVESRHENEDFTALQLKIKEAECALDRERELLHKTEVEYLARIQQLENDRATLNEQIFSIQKSVIEEQLKFKEVSDQLRLAKYNLEANKQEFDDYKQKAQRILQSKDDLISTLKSGVLNVGNGENGNSIGESELQIQLAELSQERDLLREDLQQAQLQHYNLRSELQDLEQQLASEQRISLDTSRQLQGSMGQFQEQANHYRMEADQLRQESQSLHDEMTRQQINFQTKLQQKDAEIDRLAGQMAARSSAQSEESEIETRVRNLTENLVHKQTLIDCLMADKQSLVLQLEMMEKRYREAESAAIASFAHGDLESGLLHRVPVLFQESPTDTGMARGVKRAYSTIDALSVKLGVFLRRYPVARVIIFIYVVLLHIWVMMVLMTYSPEIHSADYVPPVGKLPDRP